MRLGLIAVVVLAAAGCQRPRWDTPVDAFRTFQISLKKGDAKAAWDGLSRDSRGRIEARLKSVAAASGGVVPEEAAAMALATGLKGDPIADVTLKESSGDTAVVVVKLKDVEREQKMVREDGKWRLDLLPVLPET
jgi:hypothetical protein